MFKLMLIDEQDLTRGRLGNEASQAEDTKAQLRVKPDAFKDRGEPSNAGTRDTGGKHGFLVHIMPKLILDEEKDFISYI